MMLKVTPGTVCECGHTARKHLTNGAVVSIEPGRNKMKVTYNVSGLTRCTCGDCTGFERRLSVRKQKASTP